MDKEEREKRMFSKLVMEDEHFTRLLARGLDSFTVADELTHVMLETLDEGFRSRFPDESSSSIKERIREHVLLMERIKTRGVEQRRERKGVNKRDGS
nr:hypothetical protein [Candidatus Sigynarchaeota archaeon]